MNGSEHRNRPNGDVAHIGMWCTVISAVLLFLGCNGLINGPDDPSILSDNIPPTITLTSHDDGNAYGTVTLVCGTVTDVLNADGDPGKVVAVSYRIVGTGTSGTTSPDDSGKFSFELPTSGFSGPIQVKIQATDMNGNGSETTLLLTAPNHFLSFSFLPENNGGSGLSNTAEGVIGDSTITVEVPPGTDLTSLVATYDFDGEIVRVSGVTQVSGTTANSFLEPVEYRIVANDGTIGVYTVVVNSIPARPDGVIAEAVSDREIRVSWNDQASNETGYEIQRSNSIFSDYMTVAHVDANVESYADVGLAPGETCFYRVRGVNAYGVSDWSELSYDLGDLVGATTPTLQSPTTLDPNDGVILDSRVPVFELWARHYRDTLSFEIQLGRDESSLLPVAINRIEPTRYELVEPLDNLTTYYWRARIVNEEGATSRWTFAYSGPWAFTIQWGSINTAQPPRHATTTDTTPVFQWDAAEGADHYEFQCADSEQSLEQAELVELTETTHTLGTPLENRRAYEWRVRAVDPEGVAGPWSTSQFNINWGAMSGLSTGIAGTPADTTPTFRWDSVDGADHYEFQTSTNDDQWDQTASTIVFSESHTPVEPLVNNRTHFWRVRALDADGQCGTWEEGYPVDISWGDISLDSPSDGAAVTETNPTFQWTSATGAQQYEIQIVQEEPDFSTATTATCEGVSYVPPEPLTNNADHYWRVRAVDGDGQAGHWAGPRQVGISWGEMTGLFPGLDGVVHTARPTISWNNVSDADSYLLQTASEASDVFDATAVSLLDNAYTFADPVSLGESVHWRVKAQRTDGTEGAWSTVRSVRYDVYQVGETGPAGGVIFYDKGQESDGWRYLEAAPNDLAVLYPFGPTNGYLPGTERKIGAGKSNTEWIVSNRGTGNYAAAACAEHTVGQYDDWFLPSPEELNELYEQRDVVGGFDHHLYWSSYEANINDADCLLFSSESTATRCPKDNSLLVRPIRRF